MSRLVALLFLAGCAVEPEMRPVVNPNPPHEVFASREVPSSATVVTTRHVEPTPEPYSTTEPVNCQDQEVLRWFAQKVLAPICIAGSETEPPAHAGCYYSLGRGVDGSIRAPTSECHAPKNCKAARGVATRVRSDGKVEEFYTGRDMTVCP